MRKGFVSLLLLAAILLTIGSGEGMRGPVSGEIATCAHAAERKDRHGGEGTTHGRAAIFSSIATERGERSSRAATEPVRVLEDDDAALLGEMSELQILAQGTAVELDNRQWTALAAVALETQTIRHRYEAQIARRVACGPDRTQVEIPMYPAAGDALRERFHAELRAALGADEATRVLEGLGARMEGHFAGFGVAVQTLEITGDPRGLRPNCEVTRTIKYWNSVNGTEQLTTRRETHFPAWEDPSGDNWGALLAVAGA